MSEGPQEAKKLSPKTQLQLTLTCNRRNVVPALSIFVALLIAGQAVSVYFLSQQQSKINELDLTTKQLKLNDMIDKLPGSPPSQQRPKLRIATFNAPMALRNDGTMELLEKAAMDSNGVGDAVRYMLQMQNPMKKYPSFNGTVLENLRKLRRSLSYEEWTVFDTWMQQWYLFYLVQNSKELETPGTSVPQHRDLPVDLERSRNLVYVTTSYSSDSAPSYIDESPSGAPLMTECQRRAQAHVQLGAYRPQCDKNGNYKPMQCQWNIHYCWCVYSNGTEIPETRARTKVDCSDLSEPMIKEELLHFAN
ncbi:hypothetical protein GDO78_006535 [Eleutherodactylus coqui]|uniref:Thyroglobulin type-1 domain-containing protein n=1 Tax=Eleutherodactylus coqui TaxID=57060 RepID=A0A8J6FQL3_ELECQ|nr:hypothetical protein GDO78_006535 [Eleutherodactylus coqui]